jgi:UMF1 family MFS transporter
MVGKFGTVLGPALVGTVAYFTGSSRSSIVSVSLLFLVGGLLLYRVKDPSRGQAAGSVP